MASILKQRHFPHSTVSLREDGIVHVEFTDFAKIGTNECREVNNTIGEFGNEQKTLVLMETATNTQFDKEAREFSASPEGMRYTKADAFVVHSTAQSMLVNFYLKINKPPQPSRSFHKREDAIKWLLSI
ncbi:MAG TPA: hypothetical protein VGF30_00970 [Bacteroidia bacterium]